MQAEQKRSEGDLYTRKTACKLRYVQRQTSHEGGGGGTTLGAKTCGVGDRGYDRERRPEALLNS